MKTDETAVVMAWPTVGTSPSPACAPRIRQPSRTPMAPFTGASRPTAVPSGSSGLIMSDMNQASRPKAIAPMSFPAVGMARIPSRTSPGRPHAGRVTVICVTSQFPERNVAAQDVK